MALFDIVTVGHFAIDFIKLPARVVTKPTLGGPPTYVSLAAKKLSANVSVVSKVGGDFPEKYRKFLEGKGVDLSGLKKDNDALTTSFLLNYGLNRERELILKKRAPPIDADNVPDDLNSKAIHIAPIANEISRETLLKLHTFDSVVSLDPQGFVRKFKQDGKMYLAPSKDKYFLKGVNVFKASYNEAKAITGQSDPSKMVKTLHEKGIKVVLVTRGAESTLLFAEDKMYLVPSAKPNVTVDTTGAGDVFIGAFLTAFVRGEEPLWCACVGSAAASFVVEKFGPSGFGSEKQVRVRAAQVYDEASVVS
jgi:sugar/nucleoside kinase (ribokinase family)